MESKFSKSGIAKMVKRAREIRREHGWDVRWD